jgi:hypothetical protein
MSKEAPVTEQAGIDSYCVTPKERLMVSKVNKESPYLNLLTE